MLLHGEVEGVPAGGGGRGGEVHLLEEGPQVRPVDGPAHGLAVVEVEALVRQEEEPIPVEDAGRVDGLGQGCLHGYDPIVPGPIPQQPIQLVLLEDQELVRQGEETRDGV